MDGRRILRLLVVNDQREYCEHLKEQVDLNSHLYQIECQYTTSGKKALQMIKQWHPAVVLLDAHIGDINSFKVLQRCKGGAASIIVTSEFVSRDIEQSAMRNGATGYYATIDDPEGIEHLIEQIMTMADGAGSLH
jgi:DNA-binding NarL/FixJ family response regulator